MPTWLLDLGASSHFCFNLNDFIEYQKYKPHERTPVTTAAHTIYVKGEGAVLLKYNVNSKTVRTHLEHVLHMPQITKAPFNGLILATRNVYLRERLKHSFVK